MGLPNVTESEVAAALADISKVARGPGGPVPKASAGTVITIAVLLVAMIAGGMFVPGGWNLVVITATLLGILGVLSYAIVDKPLGFLINEQNLMSLSRLQMAVWTIVLLASYLSYALLRIRTGGVASLAPGSSADPLNIVIDPNLLILAGISTTSFVASPLILGTKKDKTPAPTVAVKTALASGDSPAEVNSNRQGTLYGNSNIADAVFTDMFQGDELGNTMHIDMAKVQMFFFTVVSASAYLVLVFHNLGNPSPPADFSHLPTLSDGVPYALGISHAGYLASKGVDHTAVQPPGPVPPQAPGTPPHP